MVPEKACSQPEILAAIDHIEQENFILANAARMVYFAGFHKNEIENIRIKDARQNSRVLSQIAPFLRKTKKAYTSMPIILDTWPRNILDAHIKRLEREGYAIDDEAPLFPDPKSKKSYSAKNLYRHFKEYFQDINFDDLRKLGIEREQRRLRAKYGNTQKFDDELLKYSRHSRPKTTQQFIEGEVQKAGKRKKEDLPWEIIVKMIEYLPNLAEAEKIVAAQTVKDKINTEIKEKDVIRSLDALLKVYMQQLTIR